MKTTNIGGSILPSSSPQTKRAQRFAALHPRQGGQFAAKAEEGNK